MTSHPRHLLGVVRGKARIGIFVEGLGMLALSGAVWFVLSYALDRTLRLEVGYRAALLVVLAASCAYLVWTRLLRPLAMRLSDDELALAVERHDEVSKESLISALHFERVLAAGAVGADSPDLMRQVVSSVHQRAANFAYGKALDGKRVMRFLGIATACVVLWGVWISVDRAGFGLWVKRNLFLRAIDWPRATLLTFADGAREIRVPEGDDMTLRVRARGVVPEQVFADCRFANGERTTEPMTITGEGEFTLELQALLHDVRVRCNGGDGETDELTIKLVQRPRILGLALRLSFPEYMHRESEAIGDTEVDVRVPRGGKLGITAKGTKPLQRAFASWGADRKQALAVGSDKLGFSGEIEPDATGVVTLDVLDHDSLGAAKPPRFFVRIVEDMPPRLEFKPLGVSSMITAQARIPGSLKARDDWGLASIEAALQLGQPPPTSMSGGPAQSQPTTTQEDAKFERVQVVGLDGFKPPALDHSAIVVLDLLPWSPDLDPAAPGNRLRPDMTVSLKFLAKDNFGPGQAHQGESEVVTFRVVTREKLLEELQRRQEEQRRELIQILETEKTDLSDLKVILSPTANDPRAPQVKARLGAMTRTERGLGKRTQQVAERFQGILDEMANNRLAEEGLIRKNEAVIIQPLQRLFSEAFPTAAGLVAEFALTGKEDVRGSAVAAYESIVYQLEQVLKHMQGLENLSAILRDLRELIKLQSDIRAEVGRRRTELGDQLLGPTSRPAGKDDKEKETEKKK